MMCKTPRDSNWVSMREAARRSGLDHNQVRRLVDSGQIGVRQVPGCHPRVRADEVTALVEASTTPADESSAA
jgi:excisionase family DNA binding protein